MNLAPARISPVWPVALVSFALISLVAVNTLWDVDWDPTVFVAFGEEAELTRAYGEERLGTVFLRPQQGHDGKFFFVQANDPWVLHPAVNAAVLDRPLYRSQRMLFPVIASGVGLLNPQFIPWGMLITNVLAIVAGTWATSMVAVHMGVSRWAGLAFALNLGFVNEFLISGGGVVAGAAAFAGLAFLMKGRNGWAVLMLTCAVLAREAMVIAAVGSAWWMWVDSRPGRIAAVKMLAIPISTAGLWALYLRARIGWETGVTQVQELGLPFVGFFEAAQKWIQEDPFGLVVGLVLLAVMALFTIRVLRSRYLVGWALLGFVLLGTLFTKQVWAAYFDISRAIAPVITAYVLILLASKRDERDRRGWVART